MKNNSILAVITLSLLLGGCGLKDRFFKSKNTNEDRPAAEVDEQDSSKEIKLTGMLLVLEPEKCPLVEGCGPRFSLLGRQLKSQVAIEGDIRPEHRNLILSALGTPGPVPAELLDRSGYERVSKIMRIKNYQIRSSLPYHPFLIEQATKYTTKNFGCDLLWDKSYSWTIEDNVAHLIVRMTNTFSDAPQPWLQLTYDGNSGDLIKATLQPQEVNPCAQ